MVSDARAWRTLKVSIANTLSILLTEKDGGD